MAGALLAAAAPYAAPLALSTAAGMAPGIIHSGFSTIGNVLHSMGTDIRQGTPFKKFLGNLIAAFGGRKRDDKSGEGLPTDHVVTYAPQQPVAPNLGGVMANTIASRAASDAYQKMFQPRYQVYGMDKVIGGLGQQGLPYDRIQPLYDAYRQHPYAGIAAHPGGDARSAMHQSMKRPDPSQVEGRSGQSVLPPGMIISKAPSVSDHAATTVADTQKLIGIPPTIGGSQGISFGALAYADPKDPVPRGDSPPTFGALASADPEYTVPGGGGPPTFASLASADPSFRPYSSLKTDITPEQIAELRSIGITTESSGVFSRLQNPLRGIGASASRLFGGPQVNPPEITVDVSAKDLADIERAIREADEASSGGQEAGTAASAQFRIHEDAYMDVSPNVLARVDPQNPVIYMPIDMRTNTAIPQMAVSQFDIYRRTLQKMGAGRY